MDLDLVDEVIEQARGRKKVIQTRLGVRQEYSSTDLIAKSDTEVELFDLLDSLEPKELNALYDLAVIGGLSKELNSSLADKVDALYLDVHLDLHLFKAVSDYDNGS